MKLTKDDFKITCDMTGETYWHSVRKLSSEDVDQILKNQEVAEELMKYTPVEKIIENEKIVERLKKRIEECTNEDVLHGIHGTLQKILEEEK